MNFLGMALVVLGSWFVAALILGIVSGKLFKASREKADRELAIMRATRSIRKFLDREPDNQIVVFKRDSDGVVCSDEVIVSPEPCIICLEDGCVIDEDSRPPLVVLAGQYVPFCARHKQLVRQCIEEGIFVDDMPESSPSE